MAYHPLLVRQLRGLTVPGEDAFPGWSTFLERVNDAYAQADGDQRLLERSLDISSRELIHENAEMRVVIQSFPDLFLRLKPDGTILSCWAGHPDDLLLPPAQLIGKRIQALPEPSARARFQQALGVVAGGGPAQLVEYALTVGASERMYEARLLPVPGDQVLAIVRNITERKRAEAELVRGREAAVEVARIKSEFLANMSHEIRTPLTCVIGMTELVLDMDLAAEPREFLTMAKNSADALHSIVNDILDFSRMESGKVELEHIPFSLRDCVGTAVSSLAFRAQQKGLELVCHIAPEAAERLVGDPSRLRQLLLQLVGNAVKFTERGEVVLELDVVSETSADTLLRFSVRDTGIGIARDKRSAIFDAFAQADGSMTRRYGGTGLGLTIATQVVDLMRGDLRVESEPGVGSTFTFEVAFAREAAAVGARPPASPDVLRGMRVLVVDDNATNRSLFAHELERWRARPTAVPGGKEALVELDRAMQAGAPYGLVLLDMHMTGDTEGAGLSGDDGFEVAAAIAARLEAGTPILVLTSTGRPGDAARCRELGLAGYLTKPVLGTELLEAIRAILRSPREGRERALVTRHSLREDGGRFRILLAEDNPVNRTLVTRILEKRGYGVIAVENGRRALEVLDREAFDLVLMDIQMPELDGFEVMSIIRTQERDTGAHLPIVALTAHAMSGDEERCRAAGADAYLSKPIDSQLLLATIETLGAARARAVKARAAANGAGSDPFDEAGALRRLNGDRALLEEVITLHLENRATFLHTLDEAIETADAAKLRRLAHEMKGELATLGAIPAAEVAAQLEIAATGKDRDALCGVATALRDELRRLQGVLERPRPVVHRV